MLSQLFLTHLDLFRMIRSQTDLRDTPRDAVKASSFVRITQPHLNQREHTMHMFQNFAPLAFDRVASRRCEIS